MANYTNKCGSCNKYVRCVMGGTIRAIGNCYKRGKAEPRLASDSCKYYTKGKGIRVEDRDEPI